MVTRPQGSREKDENQVDYDRLMRAHDKNAPKHRRGAAAEVEIDKPQPAFRRRDREPEDNIAEEEEPPVQSPRRRGAAPAQETPRATDRPRLPDVGNEIDQRMMAAWMDNVGGE